MISRVPQRAFDRLRDPSMVTIKGRPPKRPNDDDEEENEEDEDGDDEEEEPAVIREPDKC